MALSAEQRDRTPDSFGEARLLATDFDGTIALTFDQSPEGIGVHEAYDYAVKLMFGANALQRYVANGGLKNRAPISVVREMAQDATQQELLDLTEQLVATKLAVLFDQLGKRYADGSVWPRPTDGYMSFLEQIDQARSEGLLIDDLVITSGHEPFIRDTYELWGLRPPDHIVGEDTIRSLELDVPIEQVVKPSALLMDIARGVWRGHFGLDPQVDSGLDEQGRIVYVGDDRDKDGLLASNSGVAFVHLDRERAADGWLDAANQLGLGDLALRGVVDV